MHDDFFLKMLFLEIIVSSFYGEKSYFDGFTRVSKYTLDEEALLVSLLDAPHTIFQPELNKIK